MCIKKNYLAQLTKIGTDQANFDMFCLNNPLQVQILRIKYCWQHQHKKSLVASPQFSMSLAFFSTVLTYGMYCLVVGSQVRFLPNNVSFNQHNLQVSIQLNGEEKEWSPMPALNTTLNGNLLGTIRVRGKRKLQLVYSQIQRNCTCFFPFPFFVCACVCILDPRWRFWSQGVELLQTRWLWAALSAWVSKLIITRVANMGCHLVSKYHRFNSDFHSKTIYLCS